ncbi:hypothetical protein F444_20421 [Phytophthora nicotianae P1976]|uniref:Uncharacterized protein n=1 Tax=Phytophthora nicotianae P1976 TaxID=1317066 RepID=A0A080Z4N5_PHYNI|nr:hypothetical protein F444_20421 [Phytophthora nicotianae P1976]
MQCCNRLEVLLCIELIRLHFSCTLRGKPSSQELNVQELVHVQPSHRWPPPILPVHPSLIPILDKSRSASNEMWKHGQIEHGNRVLVDENGNCLSRLHVSQQEILAMKANNIAYINI